MADPDETLVPFEYGNLSIVVTSSDALMLCSDLLLHGNAYVMPDGDRHRRVRPADVLLEPEARRIEKWIQS